MAFAAVSAVAQQPVTPFVVGIWGAPDGIIPFADFDGQRWRSSWPAPQETVPDERALQHVPAAWWGRSTFQPTWEVIESGGGRRAAQITATGYAGLGSSCAVTTALKTNVPAETYGYGEVLAANRAGVLEPVRTVTAGSSEWRSVSALLPGLYRRHGAPEWRTVPSARAAAASFTEPVLETAFTSSDDGGQLVYFESSRPVTFAEPSALDDHPFLAGWLWRRSPASPFQAVTILAVRRDGDRKGVSSFTPLGIVRHGRQRFWMGMFGAYVYAAPAVFDVRRAGVVRQLVVDHAGC